MSSAATQRAATLPAKRRSRLIIAPPSVLARDDPAMARRRSASLLVAESGKLTVLRDAERPAGRLLRQGDREASYVDLADPRHLEFDYLRWSAIVLEASGARDIVHVGGAGCALARAL